MKHFIRLRYPMLVLSLTPLSFIFLPFWLSIPLTFSTFFWRSLYGCRYLSWSAAPKRTSSDQIVFQVSHPRPSLVLAFPSMNTNTKPTVRHSRLIRKFNPKRFRSHFPIPLALYDRSEPSPLDDCSRSISLFYVESYAQGIRRGDG